MAICVRCVYAWTAQAIQLGASHVRGQGSREYVFPISLRRIFTHRTSQDRFQSLSNSIHEKYRLFLF